jgi:multidrug efflux pump
MWLSDLSVKRPVLAVVVNLLVIVFGLMAFDRLPLREFPDIDPPIVSITTLYPGAAAAVVESSITELIEDRISGIEGIVSIGSQSIDGQSRITIEFDIDRDIDAAANDIRDRVASVLAQLPDEADPPQVQKANSDEEVIMWLNFEGKGMSIMELTDYAQRYLVDRFSALNGVAQVRIGGEQTKTMRIWLNRDALAARQLTVADIEAALREENVELPAGYIESDKRDFTVRLKRSYNTAKDFENLPIATGADGYVVRLKDVARVEVGPRESRGIIRGNGLPMVGIGITKQSTANTLEVAELARAEAEKINQTLPPHMAIRQSFDTSIFIDRAITEVFHTLFISVALVVLIIYLFLGNLRATLVPSVTVPVSLIGTFIVLYALGFTVNLLTLLALVLAIGLVVDDAIVVIENIHRRTELGEPPLLAAYLGTRQVGFAVIATTLVLVAVFLPITFLEGDIGRLFSEFAVTMSAAVLFSSFVALTFSPMLASKLLQRNDQSNRLTQWIDTRFASLQSRYLTLLEKALHRPLLAIAALALMLVASILLIRVIPSEYIPKEDRGAFSVSIRGPEGASYNYIIEYVNEVEKRLMPLIESGEISRMLMRVPGSFGVSETFNDARAIIVLAPWESGRKPMKYYMDHIKEITKDIPGVRISTLERQSFGAAEGKPVQFVLGAPSYEKLAQWRDILLEKARANPRLIGVDHDFYETKPQIGIRINRDQAASLGVDIATINNTLQTLLGTRQVTTYIDNGEEYDVLLESEKDLKRSHTDIGNIYVRSNSGALVPLSTLATLTEFADATALNRYNRIRAVTFEAGLADGYSLGEALTFLENTVRESLPAEATIDYKGGSLDYKESSGSVYIVFGLALLVVFLVLAGQFESFVHPTVIMFTVPLATTGALLALWLSGQTLNIYSQIGLIILVGLSAKNGILIVEFINQLRDEGIAFRNAILEASAKRLRPILMTGLTTAIGAVPLILATGAGAETRRVIGIVIFAGVIIATLFTLFVIPTIYQLMARRTQSPHAVTQRLEKMLQDSQQEYR